MSNPKKFRAWSFKYNKMFEVSGLFESRVEATERVDEDGNITLWNAYQVMQFTGLLDKNWKEIYEGDKVISSIIYLFDDSDIETTPATIVWLDKLACFGLELDKRQTPLLDTLIDWKSYVFEVIGNIYQNGNLLKDK